MPGGSSAFEHEAADPPARRSAGGALMRIAYSAETSLVQGAVSTPVGPPRTTSVAEMVERVRRALVRGGAAAEDAWDIVQEAFARLEAYRRAATVMNEEAFLMRTALNLSRDQARRRRTAPFVHGETALDRILDAAPATDEVVRGRERLRRISAGLGQLEPQTRRCLLDQRLNGLTFAQIAEREGIPLTTVEKRVARAVIFLTKWMDGW